MCVRSAELEVTELEAHHGIYFSSCAEVFLACRISGAADQIDRLTADVITEIASSDGPRFEVYFWKAYF